MRKRIPIFMTAALALLLAAFVAGCGGVPGNAVATVDGEPIEKESFDHWMQVASKSSGQPDAQVPDHPEFTRCVAAKKEDQPEQAEGQPKPTDAQLKEQCEQEYTALRDQVMQLLVSFEWIEGQAEEMDITVTDEEVQKSFDEQKEQSFPKEKDFEKFLKDSGQTMEDIMLRVRLDTLSNKIREKVTEGKDKVTDEQVSKYYEENKERFAQPERRDLRVVLTKTKPQAERARDALEDGTAFGQVAKRFSIDQASKSQGGKLPAVAKGQQEKALDDAVFSADRGELTGPVKTQFGYYVFEVTKVEEASQQSLEEAKPTIRQLLASQGQQEALDSFVEDFRETWKDKTECREGYITQDCKNAPEEDEEATPTPGAPGTEQPPPPNGAPEGEPTPPTGD
jgi:foldase protein PrsA